jgi:hypothetical protein
MTLLYDIYVFNQTDPPEPTGTIMHVKRVSGVRIVYSTRVNLLCESYCVFVAVVHIVQFDRKRKYRRIASFDDDSKIRRLAKYLYVYFVDFR